MLALEGTNERQLAGGQLDPAYAQFRDQTRFWIQRVAVPMLMVIGLFGNSITMVIMTRRRMRSTTNMYLAALAFVDMLYLVLTFLLGLSHYPNMAASKYYAYWKLRPFLMMLTDACSNTSVWLTVTFTIERYIAVKYPMKGKVWCTEARARMLIVGVFLFGILFASPVPFEWKVIEKMVPVSTSSNDSVSSLSQNLPPTSTNQKGPEDQSSFNYSSVTEFKSNQEDQLDALKEEDLILSSNSSTPTTTANETTYNIILALDYSDFGRNETYKTIYYWSTAVIFYFIPLFSLMLFNGFLIKSVHQSRRERTKMVNASDSGPHSSSKTDSTIVLNGATGLNNQPQASSDGGGGGCIHPGIHKHSRFSKSLSFSAWHKRKRTSKNGSLILGNKKSWRQVPIIDGGHNSTLVIDQTELSVNLVSPSPRPADCDETRIDQNSSNEAPTITLISPAPQTKETSTNVQSNCDRETLATHGGDICMEDNVNVSNEKSIQVNEEEVGEQNQTDKTNLPTSPMIRNSSFRKTVSSFNSSSKSSQATPAQAPVSSQERRITIMLIAVVILFLICQIPSAAMLLYTSVNELVPNTNEHAIVLAFGNIFNFLMAVNAAGNFILYSFLSKKYRRTFMILFCSCFGSKQKYLEPKRGHSVRFESSNQSLRNSTNYHLGTKSMTNQSDNKVQKDTQL